jgi:hypothetical protein
MVQVSGFDFVEAMQLPAVGGDLLFCVDLLNPDLIFSLQAC